MERRMAAAEVEEAAEEERLQTELQIQEERRAAAATKLQAIQRGKLRKKSMMHKRQAASKLQNLTRARCDGFAYSASVLATERPTGRSSVPLA